MAARQEARWGAGTEPAKAKFQNSATARSSSIISSLSTAAVRHRKEAQWQFLKRWNGKRITGRAFENRSKARWTVQFILRGRRAYQAVPEVRTQAQAERAEIKLREESGHHGGKRKWAVKLADFFEQTYLPTLKGSAHRDASSRGKLITDF